MSLATPPSETATDRATPRSGSAEGRSYVPAASSGRWSVAHAGDTLLWACASALVSCLDWFARRRELVFSTVATIVFYLPSLASGSAKAGFMYVGDTVGYYWPMLVKLRWLLSRHHFTAIDYSQYCGSADFFLAPNFFACHPFFVLWAILSPPSSAANDGAFRALVLTLAVHGFIACYFSLRLLTRFFGFDFWTAAFAALAFAFSVPMIHSHAGFPNFVFCAAILPWAAYAALHFEERPGFQRLVLAAVPVVMAFLGGYVPLGAACLGVAVFLVALRLFMGRNAGLPRVERMRRFCLSMLPFALGTLVVAPYLVAIYFFVKASPVADRGSLFFSAHELAELPQTMLRLFSFRYPVPGPKNEFSLTWGFIAVGVFALFLSCRRAMEALQPDEWTLVKASAALYFVIALAIFGQHSVVSDLFYYFLPQVGKMHIYQRLLLPAQFAFGIMLALMLKSVAAVKPSPGLRLAVAVFGILTIVGAFAMSRGLPLAGILGLNNYVVYELLLATLAMAALLVPGRTFAMAATAALFALPALDQMYDYSQGSWSPDVQRSHHGVALDPAARQGVVDYLRRFGDRDILKYADVTPRWLPSGGETFPKEFPSFVLDDVRLSSAMGFNYYLASRADYMVNMPYLGDARFHPNWEHLRRSGIDFAIGLESDIEWLTSIGDGTGTGDVHRLPHGAVIVPLRTPGAGSDDPVFENGYLRVFQGEDPQRRPDSARNIALGKPARQSSEGGGPAARAVDGNVDGRFAQGSVSHTGAEQGAWLEVDLGESIDVECVRVWNRAEVAHRLKDFWVLVSDQPCTSNAQPTAADAAGGSRKRIFTEPQPDLTIRTPGARGRYVRVQLAGTKESPENILSLAEVEVFKVDPAADTPTGRDFTVHGFETNNANVLSMDVESAKPVTVQYLMGHNPRLRYTVNGATAAVEQQDGLATVTLPAGRNTFEIRYQHRMLSLFWTVYGLFGLAVAWSALAEAVAYARGER